MSHPKPMSISSDGRWVEQELDDQKESKVDGSSDATTSNDDPKNMDRPREGTEPGSSHGEEKRPDEEQQGGPPAPVGFWNPALKSVRREAFTKWCITTAILMSFIILALSLYWGALSHVDQNLSTLKVYVVDFDGQVAPYDTTNFQPIIGPAITSLAQEQLKSSKPHLGFEFPPLAKFNHDPINVRKSVYDWDAWAAIVINANATALLHSAISNGNSSYDPLGACQLVFVSARDDTTWFDYISPNLNPFLTQAMATAGQQWSEFVMQHASSNRTILSNAAIAPQAVNPAIGFSQFDLRPFYPFTAIPSVSVGLIYLIIVSFFSFSFYLPIHMKYLKPEGRPPLKFWQLTLWRWCAVIAAYFMLSLAYSLVSLAFQINFSGGNPVHSETEPTVSAHGYDNPDAFGKASFPVYWMLNFFGMIAMGLASENMAMIVGQPWTGCWLIFWVITNVCSSFYNVEIEPGFYKWAFAWPLHYVVRGSRQLLFDLRPTLALDFGVLIAWGAVNTLLYPFACYFMRWKSKHHVNEYYR